MTPTSPKFIVLVASIAITDIFYALFFSPLKTIQFVCLFFFYVLLFFVLDL